MDVALSHAAYRARRHHGAEADAVCCHWANGAAAVSGAKSPVRVRTLRTPRGMLDGGTAYAAGGECPGSWRGDDGEEGQGVD